MQKQNVHFYSDSDGIIHLANGREVQFKKELFSSAVAAHRAAIEWCRKKHLIGSNDELIMFYN